MSKISVKDQNGNISVINGLLSTGVKDVNGVEVFEGDTIEFEASNKPYSSKAKNSLVRGRVIWAEAKVSQMADDSLQYTDASGFKVEILEDYKDIYRKFNSVSWSKFFKCRVV